MTTVAYTADTQDNRIEEFKFTKQEMEWLDSIVNHHSYFLIELGNDNSLKRAYLMDATNAPELTVLDKSTYNFERRVEDEGVEKKRLKMKTFKKFWNKHITVCLEGKHSVEYVKHRRYGKLYRCRPIGWVIEEYKEHYL